MRSNNELILKAKTRKKLNYIKKKRKTQLHYILKECNNPLAPGTDHKKGWDTLLLALCYLEPCCFDRIHLHHSCENCCMKFPTLMKHYLTASVWNHATFTYSRYIHCMSCFYIQPGTRWTHNHVKELIKFKQCWSTHSSNL